MAITLRSAPANRAYDVFKTLFQSEEDLAAWMWKYKDRIIPDGIYRDGKDGLQKQYIDIIQTEDPKTGAVIVLDDMPSVVTVYGIGTQREHAVIEWLTVLAHSPLVQTVLRKSEDRWYDVTLAAYRNWAKANGIRSKMPIKKK